MRETQCNRHTEGELKEMPTQLRKGGVAMATSTTNGGVINGGAGGGSLQRAGMHQIHPSTLSQLKEHLLSGIVQHLDSLHAHECGEFSRIPVVFVRHVGEGLLATADSLEL